MMKKRIKKMRKKKKRMRKMMRNRINSFKLKRKKMRKRKREKRKMNTTRMLMEKRIMMLKANTYGVKKVLNGISITKKIKMLMKEVIQFIQQ